MKIKLQIIVKYRKCARNIQTQFAFHLQIIYIIQSFLIQIWSYLFLIFSRYKNCIGIHQNLICIFHLLFLGLLPIDLERIS